MEATGIYWKPIWHILEGRFELVLANAAHIRNVPGRKSDVNDAVWISDLLAHGLIRASFVPAAQIQDVRDLTRTRTQLAREVAQHIQRIQKTLENANIKLTSVISNIIGTSGRRILKAMIAGETNPIKLAELGSTRLKCPRAELTAALDGRVTAHHRFLIAHHLSLIGELERHIAAFDARIEKLLRPLRDAVAQLITIPGVSQVSAQVILAEIGEALDHSHLLWIESHLRTPSIRFSLWIYSLNPVTHSASFLQRCGVFRTIFRFVIWTSMSSLWLLTKMESCVASIDIKGVPTNLCSVGSQPGRRPEWGISS